MSLKNEEIRQKFGLKGYSEYDRSQSRFIDKNVFCIKSGQNANHIKSGANGDNAAWIKAEHIVLPYKADDGVIDVLREAEEGEFLNTLKKMLGNDRPKTFLYQPLDEQKDLYQKFVFYKNSAGNVVGEKVGLAGEIDSLITSCESDVAGNSFMNGKLLDSSPYIRALLAKPFVILTGNSGTGKTRIAKQFAEKCKCILWGSQGSMKEIFQSCLKHDVPVNGLKLYSVSDTAVEVYNTKEKLVCISLGIIEEYVSQYKKNNSTDHVERTEMQVGAFDGQSYSWDTSHIEKLARYVYDYDRIVSSNVLLLPVGADWTDNTKIFGYYNPLANNGTGEYIKTNVLKLIESANAHPEVPFFLILDEMNLSHVERYFSDFLSLMETPDESIKLNGYGSELKFPKNLFVTGTVNIDETTYMFSPKVLDRANVIEFKPEMDDVLGSLMQSSKGDGIVPADPGYAEAFMKLANEVREDKIHADLKLDEIKAHLDALYQILQDAGFEFSYRTVKEIRLYAIAAYELCEDKSEYDVKLVADEQIVQKILPKIHGNKKQIGEMLKKLFDYCSNQNFNLSSKKIAEMQKRLDRFQYASFV